MKTLVQIDGRDLEIDMSQPIDISIPLQFNGPQPNAYGVEPALSEPVKAGDLIGDTRLGGSVNFEQYTFIPHCNGTHTECVGHITNERISVRDCLRDVFVPAMLVSAEPQEKNGDFLITRESIEAAIVGGMPECQALIVRTLPNEDSKLAREYGEGNIPPYLTTDTMEFIVRRGVKHLLVDMPSIDRIFDDGKLSNHRIFWQIEQGAFEASAESLIHNTITELIYAPNKIADGDYLLNLQIAPFASDASPSRPVLYKIQ